MLNLLDLHIPVKNFLISISLLVVMASCTSTRKPTAARPANTGTSEPRFLENISVTPSIDERPVVHRPSAVRGRRDVPGSVYSKDIEKCPDLQFKYAILMNERVEEVTNEKLIEFLEDWYGTPYKYGGNGKMGIDCSAFCCVMMETVYGIDLPRTSREQYAKGKKIKKEQLLHGDLVFFNTTGGISHVGVYLGNNKFVHASTSGGVMISDLDDIYFKRRYVASGRVR